VSAEESRAANEREDEKRRRRAEGKTGAENVEDEEEEEDDDDEELELEIFPNGDELAVAISEDLWPGAIKYFSKLGSFLLISSVTLTGI
jgi:hypothetical protein